VGVGQRMCQGREGAGGGAGGWPHVHPLCVEVGAGDPLVFGRDDQLPPAQAALLHDARVCAGERGGCWRSHAPHPNGECAPGEAATMRTGSSSVSSTSTTPPSTPSSRTQSPPAKPTSRVPAVSIPRMFWGCSTWWGRRGGGDCCARLQRLVCAVRHQPAGHTGERCGDVGHSRSHHHGADGCGNGSHCKSESPSRPCEGHAPSAASRRSS
jgi:hypothetical protein